MAKRLKDMTLEELWELFPIVLVPHDFRWKEWAHEEMESLNTLLFEYEPRIHHIGSTAIPSIQAKPIVDILVEMRDNGVWPIIKEKMEAQGYICMAETMERLSFNKGYTPQGYAERVFHIHFHLLGDNNEILFRDYMRSHPEAAKEYEQLKMSLLAKYRNDRDGYTAAKTDFINLIVATAKCAR